MITRRSLGLLAAASALADRSFASPALAAVPAASGPAAFAEAVAAIEAGTGGRLGVAILDTRSGRRLGARADERFPLCSTFKVLAAGCVLARVDAGQDGLDRAVSYGAADLVAYSPVTGARVSDGAMALADLCAAAITVSDNTAANLILARIGGPAGLTAYLRGLGDGLTRLDRIEPALNEAAPEDPRDTTTPAAMLGCLDRLVLGDALSAASRERLRGWLLANRTGGARLRAGLPGGWRVGDKTGSGERGTTNDVGVLWPPGGAPVVAAVYLTGASVPGTARDAAIAAVARVIAAALSRAFE